MEFKKPKPKNHYSRPRKFNLPVKSEKETIGVFNGRSVAVHDWNSMNQLYHAGYFGKGSLSKGMPNYHTKKDDIPKIIFRQQFENLSKWDLNTDHCLQKYVGDVKSNEELSVTSIENFFKSTFSDNKDSWKSWKEKSNEDLNICVKSKRIQSNLFNSDPVLSPSSTDENHIDQEFCNLVDDILQSKQPRKMKTHVPETEESLIVLNVDSSHTAMDTPPRDIDAQIKKLPFIAKEKLYFHLEESFFLSCILGCLNIVDLNFSKLTSVDLWEKFSAVQKNFLERYVAYHYYRSRGWIVKSGLKFGGDYLLYKDGPNYYHANYLAKLLNEQRQLSWKEFIAMNRLVETFNKELILCTIAPIKTTTANQSFPEELRNYKVEEVLVRRWFPSKERLSKEEGPS